MSAGAREKIVVLGIMSRHPVAGVVWQTVHYLLGFERLGYEAYYVEAAAHQPAWMLLEDPASDGSAEESRAAIRILDPHRHRTGKTALNLRNS